MCSPLRTCTPAQVPSVIYTVTGKFSLLNVGPGQPGRDPPPSPTNPYILFLTLTNTPLLLPVDLTTSYVVAVRADLAPLYTSLNIVGSPSVAKLYFSNYDIERTHIDTQTPPAVYNLPATWTSITAPVNKCFLDNVMSIVTDTDIGNILFFLTNYVPDTTITLPLEIIVVKRALV